MHRVIRMGCTRVRTALFINRHALREQLLLSEIPKCRHRKKENFAMDDFTLITPGKGALLFYTAAAALCIWNALLSVLSIFVSIEPILGFLEDVYQELPPVVNISLGVLVYLIPAAVNGAGTWMKNLNVVLAIAAVLLAGFGLWGCQMSCRDALGRASEVKEREQEIADIEARLQAVKERMDRLSEENGKYRAICVQWITAWSRWQAFAVKDPTIKAVYQE